MQRINSTLASFVHLFPLGLLGVLAVFAADPAAGPGAWLTVGALGLTVLARSGHRPLRAPVPVFETFVAPDVAQWVRHHGDALDQTVADLDVSAVYVDVRHYTAFTAAVDTAETLRFLQAYYAAVGRVVLAHGATIKDYAGDGILILVGAPEPVADHAARAVRMARDIRRAARDVTRRFARPGRPLDVGVGVATGRVTAAVIGGPARREFTAVGPAINLAARLCGRAAPGEILLDQRTRDVLTDSAHQVRPRSLTLKGLPAPVAGFALA